VPEAIGQFEQALKFKPDDPSGDESPEHNRIVGLPAHPAALDMDDADRWLSRSRLLCLSRFEEPLCRHRGRLIQTHHHISERPPGPADRRKAVRSLAPRSGSLMSDTWKSCISGAISEMGERPSG